MTETFATILGTAQQLREMVRLASGGYHDDLYMRVVGEENTVHFLAASNGRSVMSYSSFNGLESVEGNAEAIIPTGLNSDTKGYLDYLSFAEGPKKIEMSLEGELDEDSDHPRLASYWRAAGALETRIRLPSSEKDLESVPWRLANRWASVEGREHPSYVSSRALDDSGEIEVDDDEIADFVPPTWVRVDAASVQESVIEPADFLDGVNYYPLVVADGEFVISMEGQAGDDSISGSINAEEVHGPDIEAAFDEGFDEVFSELDGSLVLETAPDSDDGPSPPLAVIQDDGSQTVRHVLGQFTEER